MRRQIQLMVRSAWSGVFSLESPTRITNLPGSMVQLCAASLPVAEGARIEVERHMFVSPGARLNFFEALQFAFGPLGFCGWIGDVKLALLPLPPPAGVGHVEADRNR